MRRCCGSSARRGCRTLRSLPWPPDFRSTPVCVMRWKRTRSTPVRIYLLLSQARDFKIALDEPHARLPRRPTHQEGHGGPAQSPRAACGSRPGGGSGGGPARLSLRYPDMACAEHLVRDTGKPSQPDPIAFPGGAASWEARFKTLGRHLGIAVDDLVLEDDSASIST